MSRAGQNPLADADFAAAVGEAFAAGLSRKQMCEMFNVSDPYTITKWRKDPRVKAVALPLIEERVMQVTRAVDSEIAQRLSQASEMTVRELLDIRKEFLGGQLRAQTEKADDDTIIEAMQAVEKDPDFVEKLNALISGGTEEEAPVESGA